MRPFGVTTVLLLTLVADTRAQPSRGDHNHWVLLSKSGEPREPVLFGSGARYFLNTIRLNKLALDTKVAEGLALLRLASGSENLVFHNPGAGDTVRLNQPVAIYVYSRRAFLVHKEGPRWELGLVDWEPSREPPMPRPANIYQWRFQSPPELTTRDHRSRTLITREELALYNMEKRAYLVYVREKRSAMESLSRFIEAQEAVYATVVQELAAGEKRSHWMWFIFPQVQGLGQSLMSKKFAIESRAEASAYASHPILGARLRECTGLVVAVGGRSIGEILRYPDDLKFHACMTLFAVTSPSEIFRTALFKYFDGERHQATLDLLEAGP